MPVILPEATAYFLAARQAQHCSPETIRYYAHRLEAFRRFLAARDASDDLALLTPPLLRQFLTDEATRTSASTAKHSYITLSAFCRFLVDEGWLPDNPLATVKRPKAPRTLVQTFTPEQVTALLATCDRGFAGVRDYALILLMLDSAPRVSEVANLRLDDIRWDDQTLRIMGKGSIERRVPFGTTTRRALHAYLAKRGAQETRAVFITVFGDGMSRACIAQTLKVRGRQAGLTGVRCSPHTFRHTSAVMFLRNGGDVFSLQKLLGHSDLTMTRRYAELSQTDVCERHRQFSPADALSTTMPGGKRRIK